MTPLEIGFLSIGVMLFLIYAGVHVPFVLAGTSFVGVWLIRGRFETASNVLMQASTEGIGDYIFAVIPLFVLMGLLVSAADLGKDAYRVAAQLLRRLPGSLGVTTVVANTIFAAITGISIASAAVFARVAVPEMLALGYNRRFAVGVVAGSSVLGMLIPPSVLLIVYAILTEQSIGALFMAGIVPGILLAALFIAWIIFLAVFRPGAVISDPRLVRDTETGAPLGAGQMLGLLAPTVFLVIAVIGGIYGGLFTATEAGAAGALSALIITVMKGRMSAAKFWQILQETGQITTSILFVVIAATMYSRFLGISGLPTYIGTVVADMNASYTMVLLAFLVIALVLGTIIDAMSTLLITVPLFLPLLAPFDVSLVWFGIIAVIAVEIGLLTPPFGLSCFVVRSTLADYDVTLGDVFIGALPYAAIMLGLVGLLIVFPGLVLTP